MDALVDRFEEEKMVKLSCSDGTHLTISDIQRATRLLIGALLRLTEINDGTYKRDQSPIHFDADTSPELLDAVYYAYEAAANLILYIL